MSVQFPVLFLIGRPAAGKSEIIDYIKGVGDKERLERLHIAPFREVDDFPMLWTWFEEDEILEEMGKSRLHTDGDNNFAFPHLWDLLIRRLDLEYRKLTADDPDFELRNTAIVEFSRGLDHGGFRQAFENFSDDILRRGAVLHINVSFEESLRKNRRRFNPDRPHSILEHGLPDEKLKKMYGESDWEGMTKKDPGYFEIRGIKIPYVNLDNEDDVTTRGGDDLGNRLQECLTRLWDLGLER